MKVRRFVYSAAGALALTVLWPPFPQSEAHTPKPSHRRITELRRARWSESSVKPLSASVT
jgi:hypothetical protein